MEPDESPPPVFKSWRRVYIFVICYLAFLITLFYFFTRRFTP